MASLRKSLEEKYDEVLFQQMASQQRSLRHQQMASQSRSLQIKIAHQMASPSTLRREV